MGKRRIKYGEKFWVWTFTGWEEFDWDSPVFETADDALESASDNSTYSTVTFVKPTS